MNLPSIDLSQLPIPLEMVPDMVHPYIVHLALALPLVILFLEIINLFVKKRTVGVLAFVLSLIAAGAMILAYITGVVDASLAKSMETVIETHKALGSYLVILSLVVVLFKLFSVMIRTGIVKAIYLIILIIFVGMLTKEAKSGKALVYENGININKVSELQSKVTLYQKEIAKLKQQTKKTVSTPTKTVETKVEVKKNQPSQKVEVPDVSKHIDTNDNKTIEIAPEPEPTVELEDATKDVDVEEDVTHAKVVDTNDTSVIKDINNTQI
jgi:uncharacterized membrane protein